MSTNKTILHNSSTPAPRFSNDVPDLVREVGNELAARDVDEAENKAELLVSHVIGVRHLALFLDRNRVLTAEQIQSVEDGLGRLLKGEPIQYVLGQTDFMGYSIKTDRRALIPRPETEELVQAVLDCADLWKGRPRMADVGTGTGCIVIVLAVARPDADYTAIDCSQDALALARENAKQLPIQFIHGDLLAGMADASLDAVVSNPPYIASASIFKLDPWIRDHEPTAALDGGETGAEILARLIVESARALKAGGRIFLEIGDDQAVAVRALLRGAGFHRVHVAKDMSGNDRIATGIKGGEGMNTLV